jgi:hypothetical protein
MRRMMLMNKKDFFYLFMIIGVLSLSLYTSFLRVVERINEPYTQPLEVIATEPFTVEGATCYFIETTNGDFKTCDWFSKTYEVGQ